MDAASRRQLLDGGVFNPGVEGSGDFDEAADGSLLPRSPALHSTGGRETARHAPPSVGNGRDGGGHVLPGSKHKCFPDGPVFAMERSIVKWADTSFVPSDRGIADLLSRNTRKAAAADVQKRTRKISEGLAKQVTDMMLADNLSAIRIFLRQNVAAAGRRRRGGSTRRSAVQPNDSDSSGDDNDGEETHRISQAARTLRDDRTGYSLLHLAAVYDAATVADFLLQQSDEQRLFPSAYTTSANASLATGSKSEALVAMELLLEPAEARWVLNCIQVAGDDPHLQVFAAAGATHHVLPSQKKSELPARAVLFRHFDRMWVYDPITGQLSGSQRKLDARGLQCKGYFEVPQHSLGVGGLGLGKEADFVNLRATGGSGGGNTALHLACAAGSLRLVRLLVASRADPNIRNFQGLSAMAVAAQQPQAHALEAAMM